MTNTLINYMAMGTIGILVIFCIVMGIEKMIKIILGNYILSSITLAAGESINLLINFLSKTPDLTFFGISYQNFANFFTYGKMTLILILYSGLLVLIYLKGKLHIRIPQDENIQKLLYFVMIPLTVISIILTLEITIFGIKVLDITQLESLASTISNDNYIYKFFVLTPLWIFIHGIATIIISSELKVDFKSDISSELNTKFKPEI